MAPAEAGTATANEPQDTLSIVMITPEAHPFAKTGGLAEVTGALPGALARLGHRVTIVLPRYRGVPAGSAPPLELAVRIGGATQGFRVHETRLDGAAFTRLSAAN